MLHGKKASEESEQAAKEAFSGNSLGINSPSIKITSKHLEKQIDFLELVVITKLETS